MTDISDRVIDESEKPVSMDNGEYALQLINIIPYIGVAHYEKKCPTIIQDPTFQERFIPSQCREIVDKRTNRSFGLWFYNGTLTMMTIYVLV